MSASLRQERIDLLSVEGLSGVEFARRFSAAADFFISQLAEAAPFDTTSRVALIAIGGYGRGQLAPYSDLDLLLIHEGAKNIDTLADALWYPIWDEGISLDHSVRTPKEVFALVRDDLRVALGLLDGRCVWGDEAFARDVIESVHRAWNSDVGAAFLPLLESQMAERQAANGELADLLEPDLKESHGGLRDLNVLRAVSTAFPDVERFTPHEDLASAEAVLLGARVALHRLAQRDRNRLMLQDQDDVARLLGLASGDSLMRDLSRAARTIARASDTAWRRRVAWNANEANEPARIDNIEEGIEICNGEVRLSPFANPSSDATLALRLAAVAAEHHAAIAIESLNELARSRPSLPEPWTTELREAFLRLLNAGDGLVSAVEALEVVDLFTHYLPEWTFVRSYHQRNAYHRFTADRHLLEVVGHGRALNATVSRPDLLLMACLLHDIGKGQPGDHTEIGTELTKVITARMGFDTRDSHVLTQLVRHHLLVSDTATRRDLDDPATVRNVASAVGDELTLELLEALSQADGLGTGTTAWGSWKAGLVRELCERVRSALHGHDVVIEERDYADVIDDAQAKGVVVRRDGDWLAVAAPDQPGLLATITAVLTLASINIRSADLMSTHDVAIDRFLCVPGPRGWPELERLEAEIREGLRGGRDFPTLISQRAQDYRTRPASAHASPTTATFIINASDRASVLELRTRDSLGLLAQVTRFFAELGIDVAAARLSTVGDMAVDTFYLTRHSQPLTADAEQDTARRLATLLP